MNVCACKTKSLKERMCQNAQQHDTGIDPLALQMLLPLHCLHLLHSHWCLQMLLSLHCLHLLLSHWCSQMLLPQRILQRHLCHWCSQMLLLTQLYTRSSTAVAGVVCYTDPRCPPATRPPEHISYLGAVEFGKLFLENGFFIYKILCYSTNVLYVLPDDIFRTESYV